ncbi:hypothetical protein [Thermus tengchongensis]|uniref:Uncharacterized protein n=1 Tax=Thermus tengchongensis TaxID=1214928 RepID=A0ABY2K3P9_9DEIN|nr:hypothetical protein [Thermus tengchongensis]TFU14678.1 hypothetical protein E0489_11695 [Thermus tengchongensis]
MADTAAIAAQDMRKLASTSNPLEVVQNPIVVSVSVGVLGAYLARKALYASRRDLFGVAVPVKGGGVKYYHPKPDGDADLSREFPAAATNRLLLNLAGVILGTLLINNKISDDPMLDYLGLGVAAGSFANVVMIIVGID